jgi:hypothetical protein
MSYARSFPNVSLEGPRAAAYVQRRTPGLSLEEAQFESAVEHRRWHASLEGPQAAARERPHIAHVSLEGRHPPLRAALARRYSLEGPPLELIRREGLGPALIHHNRRSK